MTVLPLGALSSHGSFFSSPAEALTSREVLAAGGADCRPSGSSRAGGPHPRSPRCPHGRRRGAQPRPPPPAAPPSSSHAGGRPACCAALPRAALSSPPPRAGASLQRRPFRWQILAAVAQDGGSKMMGRGTFVQIYMPCDLFMVEFLLYEL